MAMEVMVVFMIGILMFCVAIYYAFSSKPITIYNQGKPPMVSELTDVKKYNRSTAKLMLGYGFVFIAEGMLLGSAPTTCMVVGILTAMPGIVVVIAVYEAVIIKKYKIKK